MMPTQGRRGTARRASRSRRQQGALRHPSAKAPKETSPAQAIGQFFRTSRQSQDLSQEQLAGLTQGLPGGVSRAMISAIERGVHLPGLEVLLTLSQALHIAPSEVLERLELARGASIDVTGLTVEQADKRAGESFWAGDYRRAASYYDAALQLCAEEPLADPDQQRRRVATTEFRRAAALRRCGAASAARAAVERAIGLTDDMPELQCQAYVVLAALLVHTGCLPLARDAAERAVALSEAANPQVRGWAWIEKGEVLAAAEQYADAREAFLQARVHVLEAQDKPHEIKVEGNIGACLHGLRRFKQARGRYHKAVELARRSEMPAMEAHWLVELSRLSLDERRYDLAEQYSRAALKIAKPANNVLTTFRAEWLMHRAHIAANPGDPDRHRVAYLKKLYTRLEDHRGSAEVQDFRRRYETVSRQRLSGEEEPS